MPNYKVEERLAESLVPYSGILRKFAKKAERGNLLHYGDICSFMAAVPLHGEPIDENQTVVPVLMSKQTRNMLEADYAETEYKMPFAVGKNWLSPSAAAHIKEYQFPNRPFFWLKAEDRIFAAVIADSNLVRSLERIAKTYKR